ncbi:MAG: hypothetical protein K2L13_04300 [Opitutales bacterium]|nr:hypothetical protein [Opitutales bacterium]
MDKNTQFAIIRKLADKIKHDIPTTRKIINILDETMDIFNEDNVKSILNASVLAKVDIKTKARIFLARYEKLFPDENSYFPHAMGEKFIKIDPYLKGKNTDAQDPCIQDFNNAMNFVFDDVLKDICGMHISHNLPKSPNFNNQAHNWIWLTVQFARTIISGSELPQGDLKKAIARNYREFTNRCRLTKLANEVFSRKIEWAQPGEDEAYVRQQAFEIVQTADNLAKNISRSALGPYIEIARLYIEIAGPYYIEIAIDVTFIINQRYDRPIGEFQEEVRRLTQIERVTREILSFTQHNLTNAQNVYGFTVSDTSMPRIGLRAIMQHDLDEAFVDLPAATETRSGFEEGHTGVEQELEQEQGQEVEQEQEDQLERELEIQLITHPQHAPEQQTPLPQGGPQILRAIGDVLERITQNIAH